MPDGEEYRFEDQLTQWTTTYLDQIEECVELLPLLLHQYTEDRAYRETAERIGELEQDCDRTNRHISALISNTGSQEIGLRNTRIHLKAGQIIGLYQVLDSIPNHTEQFAEELVAIRPPRERDCLELLTGMAERIVSAMAMLHEVVNKFVVALSGVEQTAVAGEVTQIREAESECDRMRNGIITAAFAGEWSTESLVYRELALLLDAIADSTEDVTDQLIFVTGNQSWIHIESDEPPTAGEP